MWQNVHREPGVNISLDLHMTYGQSYDRSDGNQHSMCITMKTLLLNVQQVACKNIQPRCSSKYAYKWGSKLFM